MSLWSRISRALPFAKKKPVGYDLQGNKYFELPNPQGGRPKRIVEYLEKKDVADYTAGTQQLPVQWTSWLSFTRTSPPSLSELQLDAARQSRLRPMVAAIEQRELEERIRQGYLLPDGSVPAQLPAGAQVAKELEWESRSNPAGRGIEAPSGSRFGRSGKSGKGEKRFDRFESLQVPPSSSASDAAAAAAGTEPAGLDELPGRPLAPPRAAVDPNASAAELRKLAEEDTRRRMEQSGVKDEVSAKTTSVSGQGGGTGVKGKGKGPAGGVSGLKPRRRG